MSIIITKAVPDDVYGIRKVQKVTWLDTYPNKDLGITYEDIQLRFAVDDTKKGRRKIEERKKRLLDPSRHTWVAKEGGEIIGFCMAAKEKGYGKIGAIYVLPSHQEKGLGKKLIEKGLAWLGGKQDIYVNVASYNKGAINFYQKYGFIINRRNIIDKSVEPLPSGIKIPEDELIKSKI